MMHSVTITLAPLPPDNVEPDSRDCRTCAAYVDPASPVTIVPARVLDGLAFTKGTPTTVDGRSYPTAIVTLQATGKAPQTLAVVVSTVQARRAHPATMILGRDYLDRVGGLQRQTRVRRGGVNHRRQSTVER